MPRVCCRCSGRRLNRGGCRAGNDNIAIQGERFVVVGGAATRVVKEDGATGEGEIAEVGMAFAAGSDGFAATRDNAQLAPGFDGGMDGVRSDGQGIGAANFKSAAIADGQVGAVGQDISGLITIHSQRSGINECPSAGRVGSGQDGSACALVIEGEIAAEGDRGAAGRAIVGEIIIWRGVVKVEGGRAVATGYRAGIKDACGGSVAHIERSYAGIAFSDNDTVGTDRPRAANFQRAGAETANYQCAVIRPGAPAHPRKPCRGGVKTEGPRCIGNRPRAADIQDAAAGVANGQPIGHEPRSVVGNGRRPFTTIGRSDQTLGIGDEPVAADIQKSITLSANSQGSLVLPRPVVADVDRSFAAGFRADYPDKTESPAAAGDGEGAIVAADVADEETPSVEADVAAGVYLQGAGPDGGVAAVGACSGEDGGSRAEVIDRHVEVNSDSGPACRAVAGKVISCLVVVEVERANAAVAFDNCGVKNADRCAGAEVDCADGVSGKSKKYSGSTHDATEQIERAVAGDGGNVGEARTKKKSLGIGPSAIITNCDHAGRANAKRNSPELIGNLAIPADFQRAAAGIANGQIARNIPGR